MEYLTFDIRESIASFQTSETSVCIQCICIFSVLLSLRYYPLYHLENFHEMCTIEIRSVISTKCQFYGRPHHIST